MLAAAIALFPAVLTFTHMSQAYFSMSQDAEISNLFFAPNATAWSDYFKREQRGNAIIQQNTRLAKAFDGSVKPKKQVWDDLVTSLGSSKEDVWGESQGLLRSSHHRYNRRNTHNLRQLNAGETLYTHFNWKQRPYFRFALLFPKEAKPRTFRYWLRWKE